MKHKLQIFLIPVLMCFHIAAIAQCGVEAGSTKTITCSRSVRLDANPKWISLSTGTTVTFRAVAFPVADTGYAVGSSMLIRTVNGGTTWAVKSPGANLSLQAMHFIDARTGYAVGMSTLSMKAVIVKTSDAGNTWAATPIDSTFALNTVFFVSRDTGFAAGSQGSVHRTTDGGSTWTRLPAPVGSAIQSIFFFNSVRGYAVSGGGVVLRTINGGQSWNQVVSGSMQNLLSVRFLSADTGFITGEGNLIMRTTNGGTTWTPMATNSETDVTYLFQSLDFSNRLTGYAAATYNRVSTPLANCGTIFKTSDAGLTWKRLNADTSNYLYGIDCSPTGTVFAAGANGHILRSPNAPDSVRWSPAAGLNKSDTIAPLATPAVTTTYTITSFVGNCSSTDSVTVFVQPMVVNAGKTKQVVCGDSTAVKLRNVFIDISASKMDATWTIKDASGKVWVSSVADKDTSGFFSFDPGEYTFSCKPRLIPPPLRIRIIPWMNDSISEIIYSSPDSIISRTFNVPSFSKYSMVWTPSQTVVGPASVPVLYKVHVSTPEGCSASDSVLVTPVALKVIAGSDKGVVCGDTIRFDNVYSNFSASNQMYKWTPSAGLNADTIRQPVSGVNATTTYVVHLSDPAGCTASDTVRVTVIPLAILASDRSARCRDTVRLLTLVNVTDSGRLSYTWSPSAGLDSIHILSPLATVTVARTYIFSASTSNGCLASDTIQVTPKAPDAPDICIAGVDSANRNLVVWNKQVSVFTDSFFVYRETNVTDIYQKIGSQGVQAFSTYRDLGSAPQVQSNKYKLSVKDNCGSESPRSSAHKTMHLTINKGVNNSWNLIWGAYEGITVATYNVFRGTNALDLQQIGTSAGSNTQYTDLNAPAGDILYQVEVITTDVCQPSKSYNSSRSNIANTATAGISQWQEGGRVFSVYPNPAAADFTIQVDRMHIPAVLNVYDLAGKMLGTEHLKQQATTVAHGLPGGMYIVEVNGQGFVQRQRLVVRH